MPAILRASRAQAQDLRSQGAHFKGGGMNTALHADRKPVLASFRLVDRLIDAPTRDAKLQRIMDFITTAERADENVAIRLPGQEADRPVWLPLDAKFPTEDYQRLQDAQEAVDAAGVEAAARALETRVRLEAKTIAENIVLRQKTCKVCCQIAKTLFAIQNLENKCCLLKADSFLVVLIMMNGIRVIWNLLQND